MSGTKRQSGEEFPDDYHQEYEPEAPIHHAVNITRRHLLERCRTKQHDEYDLWVGVDPVTGVETDFWRDNRESAIEDVAHAVRMDTCHVNECVAYLGEDSDALYCDEHRPDEYIECAVEDCDYPTSHTLTDYCSGHTWRNGRSADTNTDESETAPSRTDMEDSS